ncbi:transposase [bacterium]|nr:transposase [bacterium]MBU1635355.1 transposase [bacterium]MBU1873408.1 transposase [bacterium]
MMKDTKHFLHFKPISGKKVIADFNGGDVTSDAGLLFLRELESELGVIQRIADVLPDRRHQSYVQHSVRQLLTQCVFQIAAGYEDANDCDHLKDDPVLKMACNRLEGSLASQPTMSRFENGFSRTDLYRIAQAFLDTFIQTHQQPGYYEMNWDGRNSAGQQVSSGIYLYRIQAGSYVKTQKMVLMK